MSNINTNFNSNNDEFTSLKEAIFKRAREKAEALNSEIKNNYTSDLKNDIMESARHSIKNNPFLNLYEENVETETKEYKRPDIKHANNYENTKQRKQLSKINNSLYTTQIRNIAMREASETIRQNKNIMECLNFLNTQAAITNNKNFFEHKEESVTEITFGI